MAEAKCGGRENDPRQLPQDLALHFHDGTGSETSPHSHSQLDHIVHVHCLRDVALYENESWVREVALNQNESWVREAPVGLERNIERSTHSWFEKLDGKLQCCHCNEIAILLAPLTV